MLAYAFSQMILWVYVKKFTHSLKFSKVWQVLPTFRTCTDLLGCLRTCLDALGPVRTCLGCLRSFGPVRTCLNTFGCIRMPPNKFGCVWTFCFRFCWALIRLRVHGSWFLYCSHLDVLLFSLGFISLEFGFHFYSLRFLFLFHFVSFCIRFRWAWICLECMDRMSK